MAKNTLPLQGEENSSVIIQNENVDRDLTARSVQSDLDLHCPQKHLVSTSVWKELKEGS